MERPLRLEFAGALYHVTARGNERRIIYLGNGNGDGDRGAFLDVLAGTCESGIGGQFQHSNIFAILHAMARPLRLEYAGALYYESVWTRQGERDIGLSPVCYGWQGNFQPIEAYASSAVARRRQLYCLAQNGTRVEIFAGRIKSTEASSFPDARRIQTAP